MSGRHDHGHGRAGHRHLPPSGRATDETPGAERLARRRRESRRLIAALALTLTVFVAEIVGGIRSHFLALVADAGHMLSDAAAQLVSLAALYIAARPGDRRRTYGWYRVEILAALGNGCALVLLSGGILWSAVGRLRAGGGGEEMQTGMAMAVAGLGLLANLAGAWLLHGAESLNVRGAYLHVLQDTLSSVAVLAGGAVIALQPGWRIIDPLLSVGIALFVCYGALGLVRDAINVLLEAAPSGIDLEQVAAALRSEPSVREVHDLHLWTITSGIYALSAHIVVATGGNGRPDSRSAGGDGAEAGASGQDALLHRIKEALLRDFRIRHTTIQIESPGFREEGFACERCEE